MAFNNYNQNNNNGQSGEQKRTNFPLGRVFGANGRLELTVWLADTGVRMTLMIKQVAGTDPSTGKPMFEQRKASELPRFYLNASHMRALIDVFEECKGNYSNLNIVIDKGQNGGKFTIVSNGSNIDMSITGTKQGDRSVTLESVSVGSINKSSNLELFIDFLKIAYKKALIQKLDPEEFGFVAGNGSDEEAPF